MRNCFIYNNRPSLDFGIYISGSGTFNAPERDVSKTEIPGRNGDLLIDNKRFRNVELTYPAFIRHNFKSLTDEARMWLMKSAGYARLEDTYHPDQYRMARFSGPLDFDMRFLNRSGECSLTFDCKPQRFLIIGDHPIGIEREIKLYNPTPFDALPLIRVYGTGGNLMVGDLIVRIDSIDGYIDIDSDTQNAYKGSTNCNGDIYAPSFPVLKAGKTGIKGEGNITKIVIKPRWWTI